MDPEIAITELSDLADVEGIVEVQRRAWEMDDIGIVPMFEARAVADVGFVFVAKLESKVIGFIYGYHHFPDIHYSHMMAVLPEYQGNNIGFELKKFHRKSALDSSHYVSSIRWTVDPLLPNNAYLNFGKLGGYCNTYKINYYGDPSRDKVGIYEGVPTDRFLVIWPIHSRRVKRRMRDYKQDRVNINELLSRSPPVNKIENNRFVSIDNFFDEQFCVEVPANYQYIRENEVSKAKDWRIKFREICTTYFEKGWTAMDYHSIKTEDNKRRNFYEFHKIEMDM